MKPTLSRSLNIFFATGLLMVAVASSVWAATVTYTQQFNSGHGWTYTQTNCIALSCGNNTNDTSSYTWQTLGVPANAVVQQVTGSWWDKASSNCLVQDVRDHVLAAVFTPV